MVSVRIERAAYVRSGAAAAGALAGSLVALPVGGFLLVFLVHRVAGPIIEAMADAPDGASGLESALASIGGAIVGVMIAAVVVLSLVGPVMVLIPAAGAASALRLVKAGLILRTLWIALGAALLLGIVVGALLDALNVRAGVWFWLGTVPLGAFLARLLVEVGTPQRAALPDGRLTSGRRWRRAGIGLLGAVLLALVVVVFFLFFVQAKVSA